MFTVPDLRHEETIIQAAHALNVLQETIDNVFQRLKTRIAVNSVKAKELGARIQNADERIQKLMGVKKAVQIYAPARYPATHHLLRDPLMTFSQQHEQQKKEQDDQYEIKSGFESIYADNVQEKLEFFHLSTPTNVGTLRAGASPEHIIATRLKVNSKGHTLGAPPQNLRSVATLLRFNSEEEAYSKQTANEQSVVRPDSWRRSKLPKNPPKMQKKLLEPAPHSLANRNQRATPAGDLRYMPKMHEAPIIDLPMDLPSLDGVAQDIHFLGFENTNAHIQIKILKEKESENDKETEEAADKSILEVMNTITTITPIFKPKEKVQTHATAPPPPPPPPPPTSSSSVINDDPKVPPATSDTRSALMDAIRKAGGASGGRLRSAAAAPVDVTDNKKVPGSSTGNLMEDLHNKLLMRRKGISGSAITVTKTTTTSGNPVLQRLSALIPPPPNKQTQQQQHSDDNTEDGDWD